MEVSEEQKQRMESNRAAALARRNAKLGLRSLGPQSNVNSSLGCRPCPGQENQSTAFKPCMNIGNHPMPQWTASVEGLSAYHEVVEYRKAPNLVDGPENQQLLQGSGTGNQITGKTVKVALEICAPDRFFVMVTSGFFDPGFLESISSAAKCENLEPFATWPVYNLKDYDKVTEALKSLQCLDYGRVPWSTRSVLENFQKAADCGAPVRPNHITDLEVEHLLLNMPPRLSKTLLPFQKDGVKFGLLRGGRCLIADEMGVGKTIQAIGIASCYREEGSLLVICPASMRNVWADELERWLPYLSPLDVHLVFGRKNKLTDNMELPKVVVISFYMLARLRESMLSRKWGMIIVDEAHNLRCTRKKVECDETMAVLDLAQNVKRVVLLTGTPSLSRPFDIFNQINCLWPNLLGENKFKFALNYCGCQSNFEDLSKGSRLSELNVLLKQTVMIRRLKDDIMQQLPPKRRQLICLQLGLVDIKEARALTAARISARLGEEACKCGFTRKGVCDCEDENSEECKERENPSASGTSAKFLSEQEIGVAKLRGFQEWLLNNSIFAGRESQDETSQEKMIIFAHHMKVLDSVQTFVQSRRIEFVRIDGSTPHQDRLKSVNRFQFHSEVRLAIIGVRAGGVGLDFSAAQSVAFVELPKSASEMLQAEDRAHRRGQKNAVNIYIFAAKGTADDRHWQSLSRSLERMSTMTDGAQTSLDIETVVDANNTWCQTDISVMTESNRSLGVDATKQFSKDSCITTETNDIDTNSISQRLISSQFEDMTGGQGETSVGFPAMSLMFEVSSNTGRIHLFLRSSDECMRPMSLQANFKPEDLAYFAENGICERAALPNCLAHSAAHREVAILFWKEYSALRSVLQKRLRGRPLSIPLSVELELFNDKDQYDAGGVLKGGSKRRWTPKDEVGGKIPAGAASRPIFYHTRNGLKVTKTNQAWNAEGVPLCKFCQQPCKGKTSMRPESFDDLFCQITCREKFDIINRRYIREELFKLEGGVCVKCSLDCHALVDRIRPLLPEMRRAYILDKACHFLEHKNMLEKLIKDPTEGNAWHADHIVAVADGGGECRLENFQTLCISCHAKVTAEQHRRRTSEKMKNKADLKRTMKKLERPERGKRRNIMKVHTGASPTDSSESEDDRDLLDIEVAGSAYSTSRVIQHDTFMEHAGEPALQASNMEGHEPSKTQLRFSSVRVHGIIHGMTEHACESIVHPTSMKGNKLSEDMTSTSQVRGRTEFPTEDAYNSILQQQKVEGRELTQNLMRKSHYFLGCENQKPTNSLKRSSQVRNRRLTACNQTASGILAPIINEAVEVPVSKKPTFSLRSLNKYLNIRPV